jgi:pimeloyl-ACP methyl ester carboxylesterase
MSETLADDVVGVIQHLGLKSFVLVGHSMGAKVALLLAARRPEGLTSLVLIAPAPPVSPGAPQERRQVMLAAYQSREGVEAALGRLAAMPLSQAHREQVIEDSLSGAAEAKRVWPERDMTRNIANEAAKILVPVHMLVGDADTIETESSLRAGFSGVLPVTEIGILTGVGRLAPSGNTNDQVLFDIVGIRSGTRCSVTRRTARRSAAPARRAAASASDCARCRCICGYGGDMAAWYRALRRGAHRSLA